MDLYKKAIELLRIIEPYIVYSSGEEGLTYSLADDAPEEVIKADKEFRNLPELEPIR